MNVTFEMIGRLSLPKESEKFKPYEETGYDSGWFNRTLKFNVTSGFNTFLMQIKGGCFKNGKGGNKTDQGLVYVTSKPSVDKNGNRVKGENFTIPFKDRLTSKRLAEVAEFKKFVIDLEKPRYRNNLERAIDKLKDGRELSDEEIKTFGTSDKKELEKLLVESKKKRKEYITEWDYSAFIHKLVSSEKYKDKKFIIRGTYEMRYSDEKGRFYNNYIPNRMYLAEDDAAETATANVDLFFNKQSLDASSITENGKYYVHGYTFVYDSVRKTNIPAPYVITIPAAKDNSEREQKREEIQTRRFTIDESDETEVYEYGVVVQLLNGAQLEEIKFEDLTEEEQDSILIGETTLEELQRELGGGVYGERITENVFLKPARGFSKGRQETAYTDEDLVIQTLEENVFDDEESDEDSLFDEDELI